MRRNSDRSNPFRSTLNADKVIGIIVRGTPIARYRGVLENYLRWSLSTLRSEGIQAQQRLQSYKEYFENQLSTKHVVIPQSGKYRKLRPILEILRISLERNDLSSIRILNTVMRIYELARPTQKFLDRKLREYVFEMDSNAQPVDKDPQVINRPIMIEEDASAIIAREQAQYPDFPWQEFQDWIESMNPSLRELVKSRPPKVPVSATFLTKSSSAKLLKVDHGNSRLSSVPAIVAADLETAFVDHLFEDKEPLYRKFAKALLRSLNLDKSYSFESNYHEVIKDSAAFDEYLKTSFLAYRMNALVIEASNGIKERVIIKGSYPIQYSLQLLHESALAVAQMIPGDYSGDHDAGFKSLNSYASNAEYLSDIDASSWTNYFPLTLQYYVVKAFYGEEVAGLWVQLMRLPIHVNLTMPDGTEQLYTFRMHYGQPMGLYSSWAIANLSHHMLNRFSHVRVNSAYHIGKVVLLPNGTKLQFHEYNLPYWIVGDDEVSADYEAQTDYLALTSALGIKVNATKSKVLSRRNGKYLSEFVHRQTLAGSEVTGLSPKIATNSFRSYADLAVFLQFCRSRGFQLDERRLISDIVRLQKTLPRKVYMHTFGVQPIPMEQIEIGLRIPAIVGGLLPDDSDWNTKVDPLLLMNAVLFRISSLVTYFRPGAPLLRDGRRNDDEILSSMQYIPDFVNTGNTALARYERRLFADKTNSLFLREAMTILETSILKLKKTFILGTRANYQNIDMAGMKEWILRTFEELKSISATPAYLARERERRSVKETIKKVIKYDPDRFSSTSAWSDKIDLEYLALIDRLHELQGSIFEVRKTNLHEELDSFYQDLFSDQP